MDTVTLRTARLELSPPREGDADAIFAACQDERLQRYTTVPSPYTREHAEGFIEKSRGWWESGSEATWAIRDGDTLVGMIGLHRLVDGTGEIGYWMAAPARGRGLLTEAAHAVIDWGFSPDGLALKRIALQSQTELTVRSSLEARAAQAGGRVSALRVDTAEDSVAVDAVMMLPRHVNGLETQLQQQLAARTGRPVSLRIREVLTADDASFALQQSTLAELRRSVTALQDAETVRSAALRAREEQQAGMQARLLPWLGRLERAADGSHWALWLADGSLPLARAMQMESDINAGRNGDMLPLVVHPPLQALAAIPLPATDDPGADRMLAIQAWALRRWRASSVQATLVTADDAQAAAWEARLREALAA